MTDVIEFLERMGRDAELRHASDEVLRRAMRDAQMSPRATAALIGGNRAEIETVMGSECNVCCLIHAPDPDEQDSDAERKAA